MEIRPALATDAPALAELGARLFRSTYAGQIPDQEVEHYVRAAFQPEAQLSELQAPGGAILVACAGASLVGYAQLRQAPVPTASTPAASLEIARFYLDPAQHGRGLAARLMAASLAWAAARDHAWLWLQVWEHNPRAIRFYLKQGFLDLGDTTFQVGSIVYQDRLLARATVQEGSVGPG